MPHLRRRLVAALFAATAVAVVGIQFLRAAAATAQAVRANACRALAADPLPPQLRGTEAPDFELQDTGGRTWTLRGLRGRPVLVNFWATWCPPCIEEMPSMEELARRLGNRAVVLAVSVDEDWDTLKRFFAGRTVPLAVLLDASKQVPKSYGTEKYPETFLIDGAGRVRHAFINKRNWATHDAVQCVESVL